MPALKSPLVVALLYDGLCTFEFGIAAEVFGLDRPEMGADWYRFASAAIESGPLRAQGGFSIIPDGGLELLDGADMVIVPGWKGKDIAVPSGLVERLSAVHARGGRLASICSGAFVLAATGLLNGRKVTTHWRYADELRLRYPAIIVDEASLYHGENNIFTSAGSAAGIDLMIELVRHDYGPDAANSVARRIVMPAHRNGDQAQYVERPVRTRPEIGIGPLLDHLRLNLHANWSTATMARHARLSRRTLERRFVEATGQSPGDWLVVERVEAAKDILIRTKRPMEEVAAAVGFGSAHALRHHFRARVSLSPGDFRREFGGF